MLFKNKKTTLKLLVGLVALSVSSIALAEYVPFPGKREVRLVDVEAANIIVINFETWPGFPRMMRIKLPNLDIPGNSSKPKACELELAQKALTFTREFVADSTKVTIKDMLMKTSADEQAISSVYTDKGSLGMALSKAGLARPSSVDADKPWCK